METETNTEMEMETYTTEKEEELLHPIVKEMEELPAAKEMDTDMETEEELLIYTTEKDELLHPIVKETEELPTANEMDTETEEELHPIVKEKELDTDTDTETEEELPTEKETDRETGLLHPIINEKEELLHPMESNNVTEDVSVGGVEEDEKDNYSNAGVGVRNVMDARLVLLLCLTVVACL